MRGLVYRYNRYRIVMTRTPGAEVRARILKRSICRHTHPRIHVLKHLLRHLTIVELLCDNWSRVQCHKRFHSFLFETLTNILVYYANSLSTQHTNITFSGAVFYAHRPHKNVYLGTREFSHPNVVYLQMYVRFIKTSDHSLVNHARRGLAENTLLELLQNVSLFFNYPWAPWGPLGE